MLQDHNPGLHRPSDTPPSHAKAFARDLIASGFGLDAEADSKATLGHYRIRPPAFRARIHDWLWRVRKICKHSRKLCTRCRRCEEQRLIPPCPDPCVVATRKIWPSTTENIARRLRNGRPLNSTVPYVDFSRMVGHDPACDLYGPLVELDWEMAQHRWNRERDQPWTAEEWSWRRCTCL